MKYISKFEDFLNESKSIPSHVEKAIKDLAYSMPNHTKSEDGKFTDEQVLKAIKKYSPVLTQAIKNGLEKEILDGVQSYITESSVNEGVASLDSYYRNAEKSVRDSAKKIDAILNKEIKSDATKKELLDLITDMVEEYAVEYADNRDQERY